MRILLAEDDSSLAHLLRDALQAAGYAVDIAPDGVEADFLAREGLFDAVILDLGLPRKSGLEVLCDWRASGIDLPVLILTARDAWHEKVEGFRAGADDYLTKPFHTEELLARLSALLRRARGQAPGPLSVGRWQLDEARQEVRLAEGAPVALTNFEYRLLRLFLLHPDQVLSKSWLDEHLHDESHEGGSNVLEVLVNRLRGKLGRDVIQTRRGQGYVFVSGVTAA